MSGWSYMENGQLQVSLLQDTDIVQGNIKVLSNLALVSTQKLSEWGWTQRQTTLRPQLFPLLHSGKSLNPASRGFEFSVFPSRPCAQATLLYTRSWWKKRKVHVISLEISAEWNKNNLIQDLNSLRRVHFPTSITVTQGAPPAF